MLKYFQIFEFPENEKFMPSPNAQKRWMRTSKTKDTFGGVVLPGLYETYGIYTNSMYKSGVIFG